MSMKKPAPQEAIAGQIRGAADQSFVRDYPCLHDYLVESKWEDGSPRATSTIMLCIEDGGWKACVNDRALERSLWKSGATIEDCLEAIEAALVSQTGDWRRWNSKVRTRR